MEEFTSNINALHPVAILLRFVDLTLLYIYIYSFYDDIRGVVPTMAKQGTNQAVRFLVFTTLKDMVEARRPGPIDTPTTLLFGGTD